MDARLKPLPSAEPVSLRLGIDPSESCVMLSHLSHELCRPLHSLHAGLELLLADQRRPISADQEAHVRIMSSLCEDLLRLTKSYLDYAALVQRTRSLRLGSFTIGALVGEVDRQFASQAAECSIAWTCECSDLDARVRTDASRFQQVMGHLVANALKYAKEGGEVRVNAWIDDDRQHWVVNVADKGPGIPAGELEQVFTPFYRLLRDEQSKLEGDGLGLPICRELVEQLGGSIVLQSEQSEGVRVTVRLPIETTEISG